MAGGEFCGGGKGQGEDYGVGKGVSFLGGFVLVRGCGGGNSRLEGICRKGMRARRRMGITLRGADTGYGRE